MDGLTDARGPTAADGPAPTGGALGAARHAHLGSPGAGPDHRPGTRGGRLCVVPPTVEVAAEVTPELVEAFNHLVPQLSSSNPPPSDAELAELVASPATTVFVARSEEGTIAGTLTLCTFRIPTGIRAWIEDVVVDDAARGQGVGKALTKAAVDEARKLGAKTVDLTSRPSREAANGLYQSLGFRQRETNVYRYELTS